MKLSQKILVLSLLLIIGTFCCAEERWFLRASSGAWKSFANKDEWKKAADVVVPLETAMLDRQPTETLARYDIQAESGDWSIINEYRAQPDCLVKSLKRTVVSVSQKLQLTLVYTRSADGKMKLVHRVEVSLINGQKRTDVLEVPKLTIT